MIEGLKIILNADDVGINENVNHATAQLIEEGLVSSISIMSTGMEFQHAVDLSKSHPNVSAGIHLNIAEGRPLRANGLNPILDDNGKFRNNLKSLIPNRPLYTAIFREWCAQTERLIDHGIKISHIDSHYHVHTFPPLFRVLYALQRRYKIQSVRLTKNLYISTDTPPHWKSLSKSIFNAAIRRFPNVNTANLFTDFDTFHEILSSLEMRADVIEVMLHPGSEVDDYQREIELLRTPWRVNSGLLIELITNKDLSKFKRN
jgi:predicted glycoside hydrolase/deacetylase ChbG (UPF0249 family)